MDGQFAKIHAIGLVMQEHGLQLLSALGILILGLFITKWAVKALGNLLARIIKKKATVSIISNSAGVFMLGVVIIASAMQVGLKPGPLITFIMIVILALIGIIVIFRPLLPTLPFKVGNAVKLGNLLGRVEATTFLNTRVRTFDGKTFFVPNRQILDDIVINYHFTKTRRVKIDVTIRYDQDLLKAKRVLEALMIEDARVLPKPSPQVYVLGLEPNGVRVGGRCWVNNLKYWVTKCEMLEKTKLRFDREGIVFANHQVDVCYRESARDTFDDDFADEMPGG